MSGCFYITVSPLVDDSMKKIQLEFQPKPADDDNADNASLGSIIHQKNLLNVGTFQRL